MRPELFAQRRRSLSERLFRLLTAQFFELDNYRDADAARFARSAVPAVQGTQRVLAALIAAQHAQEASEQTGRSVAPPRVPDVASVNLRRVEPHEVYTRPFRTVYTELARGERMTTAVERGARRLESIAEGDLQLTHAHASRAAITELKALYWRRTLIGDGNCALCVLASTMRYKREDLKPIHPACDCEVVAVYSAAKDPVKDEAALISAAHRAAREATGISDAGGRKVDYRKIRTQIFATHGELGEVLVFPKHEFTDEDALTA